MDPYLEAPDLWPDVHARLIGRIGAMLTPKLRPRYFAKVESRTYLPDIDDPAMHLIIPDVQVLERLQRGRAAWDQWHPENGGAVAEAIDVTDLLIEELRESLIEIHDANTRQLVTVIEIVSPTNKVTGAAGTDSLIRKHHDCVAAGVNWLEIDLLRFGERPTAPRVLEKYTYRVFRDWQLPDKKRRRQAWPWNLRDPIPIVGVPLRPEDGEVALDLQRAMVTTYEEAGYDMMVDYTQPPPQPAMSAEDAAWVQQILNADDLSPR